MANEKMQAKSKTFTEDDTTYQMTVRYGFHWIKGNRRPYFSITADILRLVGNHRWAEYAGGCLHEDIVKHFPMLEPLIKWHLADDDGKPMHYAANAAYWLEHVHRISQWNGDNEINEIDPWEAFQKSVVFGACYLDDQAVKKLLALIKFDDPFAEAFADEPDLLESAIKPVKREILRARVEKFCAERKACLRWTMRDDMRKFRVKYFSKNELV